MSAPAEARCRDAELAKLERSRDYVWGRLYHDDESAVPPMAKAVADQFMACARTETDPTERAKLMIGALQAAQAGWVAQAHMGQYVDAERLVREHLTVMHRVARDPKVDPLTTANAKRIIVILETDAESLHMGRNPFATPAPLPE